MSKVGGIKASVVSIFSFTIPYFVIHYFWKIGEVIKSEQHNKSVSDVMNEPSDTKTTK